MKTLKEQLKKAGYREMDEQTVKKPKEPEFAKTPRPEDAKVTEEMSKLWLGGEK